MCIRDSINDFIERTWSRERYEAALTAYDGAVVIHDVARKNSVVHTDYENIAHAPIDNLIFTHNPDNLTTFRPMLHSGQRIVIRDGVAYDSVRGTLWPFDADLYTRHFAGNFVGYRSDRGAFKVIEVDGLLGVAALDHPGRALIRVDLYEDMNGDYLPLLCGTADFYRRRDDGKVERVRQDQTSSRGTVVESLRGRIPAQDSQGT